MHVKLDETLISAQSADETTGYVSSPLQGEQVTVYIETGAGVSAGTVKVEEAHDRAYAGTWAVIQSVSTAAASTLYAVHFSGVFGAVRVRFDTAITGGNVTVRVVVGG